VYATCPAHLTLLDLITIIIFGKKLYVVEVTEQCEVKISSRFVALGNLSEIVDLNRSWENSREIIKT
jgi:hypothetical protein